MTRKQLFVLLATIIGSGMVFLDGSIVNLALPHMATDLHASFSSLQWVVDGYLLSLSALILLGGSLGDILGRKKVYLTGLVGFTIVSLLCGLSPTIGVLIGLRVLQGVFGALLTPSGLAIINTNFPPEMRGQAIGRWTAWSAVTTALGPLVGGYVVDAVSWRWVFFINIPLGILVFVFGSLGITESKADHKRHVDVVGAALAMLSLTGIIYGLIEGPGSHWSGVTLGALFGGLILLVVFLVVEAKIKDPMMPPGLFKSRGFTAANATTFAMYGALAGFFFALAIYLQTTMGYSAVQTGLATLPFVLLLLLLSGRVGAMSAKRGPRVFMTVGPILAGLGIASLIPLHEGSGYLLHVLPGVLLFGVGLSLTVAPLTTTVMTSVTESESGIASGTNNMVSRVAGLIVIALLGIFGASHAYLFTTILCASLAIIAGIISWILVPKKIRAVKTRP